MKLLRKRNITLYFIIGALLISLGSVGFSSWILSIEQKDVNFSANINISDAWNATAMLNVSSTTTSISSNGNNDTVSEEDLNIPLTGTITVSNDISNMDNFNKSTIDISVNALSDLSNPEGEDKNEVTITSENTETTDLFNRKVKETYTYFDVSVSEISVSNNNFITTDSSFNLDGYSRFNLSLEGFSLKYGSYFDNKNPEKFYQEKIDAAKKEYLKDKDNDTALNTYLTLVNTAKTELEKFNNELDKQTLNIMVSLVLPTNSTN